LFSCGEWALSRLSLCQSRWHYHECWFSVPVLASDIEAQTSAAHDFRLVYDPSLDLRHNSTSVDMSQTFQRLFGRGQHENNIRAYTSDQLKRNKRLPDGTRLTVRQLRRVLDNDMFETALGESAERNRSMEGRPMVSQSSDSATSESKSAGSSEAGAFTEIIPESKPRAKARSGAPKQDVPMHLLSNFCDAHSGLSRLAFELSGVLCSIGDSREQFVHDYSQVIHEHTNLMLDAANKLHRLKTELEFSGAIPCDRSRNGLSSKPSFTVWGDGENAIQFGSKSAHDFCIADVGTDNTSEGTMAPSSSHSSQKVTSSPAHHSSGPQALRPPGEDSW